ncbi:hypothetical protein ONZ45_g4808 [Pleurotus djamor]|nr:hypothetical protein ONZ45_g4808 [Pleurotus djamor]
MDMDMEAGPASASNVDQNAPPRNQDQPRPDDHQQAGSNASRSHKHHHHHHTSHRGPTRYKEKFQAMREKYDQVVATRDRYNRELELATAKQKQLQAENDLLLDTMAVYAQPPRSSSHRTSAGYNSDHRRVSDLVDTPVPARDYDDWVPYDPRKPSQRISRPDSRESLQASHSYSNGVSTTNGSSLNGNSAHHHADAVNSDMAED